ncbi:MAG TPA: hypothetical protein PLW97_13495 [Synergistaceae bacterium]|nr:hypothetical protein [Synergistaceae bacterium]
MRRMLYFFHDFQKKSGPGSEIRKDGERYLQQFLGSGALLEWLSWQKDAEKQLYGAKKDTLRKKLYHVIQEEFTGVRLPEEGGSRGGPSYLYVTLNRGKHAVRQSAQIVLAEVDFFKEFDLVLKRNQERNQERRDLVLLGKGRLEGIRMILNLPFLDYMFARNSGYLSESLQAVYGERLSRLKNEIVSRCRSGEQKEVLLVRLQTNHTFLRQCYAVNKGRLEVWND